MEKNTLIALISIGFISVTALVLGIIGVSTGGHDCGLNRGGMMKMGNMMQGQMNGEGKSFIKNKMGKMIQGSGSLSAEQAIAE